MIRTMIKNVVFMVSLAWTSAHAQGYRPLLDTTASWNDFHSDGGLLSGMYDTFCFRYILDGDSTVNDTTYRILRYSGSQYIVHFHPPGPTYSYTYHGEFGALVREDTSARKVFIRVPDWGDGELLLYDFSIGVGAYPFSYRYPDGNVHVVSIDTVMLANGPHRRMLLDQNDEQIIEGIGSLSGLLPYSQTEDWWSHLTCHALQGVQDQDLPVFAECACNANVAVPSNSAVSPTIHPSPAQDRCYLEGAPAGARYCIFAMDGRPLGAGVCSNAGAATIDLIGYPPAMYVVAFLDTPEAARLVIIKD